MPGTVLITSASTGFGPEPAGFLTHAYHRVLISLRDPPVFVSLISAGVVCRAGAVALILGSVLTLASQSGAIFGDDSLQILPLLLVYLTPLIVATISQVLGIRQALFDWRRCQPSERSQEAFCTTLLSHDIPLRSLLLGLIMGTMNTAIVVVAAMLDGGDMAAVPTDLIGQAFALPMVFGPVSQAIAYRHAASVVDQPVQSGA